MFERTQVNNEKRQSKRVALIVVSAALHFVALVLAFMAPASAPRGQAKPIELSVVWRTPEKKKPEPSPIIRQQRKLERPKRQATTVATPETKPAPNESAQPRADAATTTTPSQNDKLGTLTLPSFFGRNETPGTTASPDPKETPTHGGGGAPDPNGAAKTFLKGMANEWTTKQNVGGADARTTQIGRGIQNAFNADKKQMNDATPNPVLVLIEQWQRDMPAMMGPGTEASDQTTLSNRRRGEGRADYGVLLDTMPINLCFGACSNGSHEVMRLQTLVQIDHNAAGAPTRWRVERSSGRKTFDDTALESVQLALGCMKDGTHHVLFCKLLKPAHGPIPKHSIWMLSGIVYRWSNTERLLDPQFKPSGRHIAQGPLAGHYLDSSVRLMELAYWQPASSQPKAN